MSRSKGGSSSTTWADRWLRPHLAEGHRRGWASLAPQVLIIAVALVMYYAVRALSQGSRSQAVQNAYDLLAFERLFGLDWELGAQQLVLDRPALVTFFNWIYVWTYWPVLLGVLLYFWFRQRRDFTIMRDALIISGAVGLVVFAVYPVAPPRFLDGFTDTVAQASREHFIAHPSGLINEYAALPSFHVGWHALAATMLADQSPRRWRPLIFAPTALMAAAIVFTANHYVIDAVAGIALSLAGLYAARYAHGLVEPRPAPAPALRLAHVEHEHRRHDVA